MTETSSHPGLERNARGFSFVFESFTWETVTMRTTFSVPRTSIGISHICSPPHWDHRASGAGRRIKKRRNETTVQPVYSFNFSFEENWLPCTWVNVKTVSGLSDFEMRIPKVRSPLK